MSRDELAETTNGPARGMSSPARAARKPPTSSDDARVVDLTTAVVDKDLNNQTTTAPAGAYLASYCKTLANCPSV